MIAAVATTEVSSETSIEQAIDAFATSKGLRFGDYQAVARLAISVTDVGPSITSVILGLGRERVKARLEKFLGVA